MRPLKGKMSGTPNQKQEVSTKLQRIADLSTKIKGEALKTLAHHIDVEFLREAYRRLDKGKAVGVDGQTAADYAENLESNLQSLLDRFKSGTYRAPPVRRVYIPKAGGKQRPIGIPSFEDKILQKAVAMILNAIYEQEFFPCSYGYRPKKSARTAVTTLGKKLWTNSGGWVLEVDLKGFFDSLDHQILRTFVGKRVGDGVIQRTLNKWLKAGIMENGQYKRSKAGTPQGGIVSPILANVYLHEVLDLWFHESVKPNLKGRADLTRYADDFVVVFEFREEAEGFLEDLRKRLEKYRLRIHPEKTKLLNFVEPKRGHKGKKESFDFLGFNLHWGHSRKGTNIVKLKTSKGATKRVLKELNDWCQRNRHKDLNHQFKILSSKFLGHMNYYAVVGNLKCVRKVRREFERLWSKWLNRRSQKSKLNWDRFGELLKGRLKLPKARIVKGF